jgi:hypothetical protein
VLADAAQAAIRSASPNRLRCSDPAGSGITRDVGGLDATALRLMARFAAVGPPTGRLSARFFVLGP